MKPTTIKLIGLLLKEDVKDTKEELLNLVEGRSEEVICQQVTALALKYRAVRDALGDFEEWEATVSEE